MSDGNILIVWDRIGDYHRARVKALEELAGSSRVFTADLGSADKLYGWKTSSNPRHFLLSPKPVEERDFRKRVGAFRKVLKEKAIRNLAIAGYGRPEYIAFLLIGRLRGCRITLFAESWYGRQSLKNRLKGFFLKRLCQVCFVSGERARHHFEKVLGIPGKRILTGYSVVDNGHFAAPPSTEREPVLLCVARFSPEKNLPELIRAFQESRLSGSHRLRIIGGGSQREELEGLIRDPDRVELRDWVRYEDLPAEYARARYFILPSRFEPWGLVVNEAMAAGLPVVVSEACGCEPDLVRDDNGFVFKAGHPESLRRVLDKLATLPESGWQERSRASLRLISGYSCPDWARNLHNSFQ